MDKLFEHNGISFDTENIEDLEKLRKYLTNIRDSNFSKYKYPTSLQHQSFCNVIEILAHLIKELKTDKN